jgi:hypothetical protein
MPSGMHRLLKMTTTRTFRIAHPDELKTNYEYFNNIEANRAVLEKMLPQFAGRRLDSWFCPFVTTSPVSK